MKKLAYLRVDDVEIGFNYILVEYKDIIEAEGNEKLKEFFAYFKSYWLSDIAIWNICNSLDHTTNNEVEEWHYYIRLKLLNGNKALRFWPFLEKIGKEDIIVQEEIAQILHGYELTSRSLKQRQKVQLINRMNALYMEDKLVPGDRLANIIAYLRGLTT